MFKTAQSSGALISLMVLFLLAPFYIHPNIGGFGLAVPLNIAVWLVAVLFIGLVLFQTSRYATITLNPAFLHTLIFPAILMISGLLSDVPQADVWLFRQLYIIGGYLFLFALFQAQLRPRQIDWLLWVLFIAASAHAVVGIIQIAEIQSLKSWLPLSENRLPIGVFQQVNVEASFLTTGFVIGLYLISRPTCVKAIFWQRALLVTGSAMIVFVVVSAGSRVGLFSLVIATLLLLYSRRHQLLRHKRFVIIVLLIALASGLAGQSGFLRAMDKTQQMTEGEFASARQTMYAIAIKLIKEKPIFGYGIGSFPRVWVEQKRDFLAQHPDAAVTSATTSHPHNEILLWFIEGGLIAVTGLIVIFIVVVRALYQCGCSRGGAYMALLFPITLHTQVELPFYSSSLHWFVWLFLLYLVFRHQMKSVPVSLTQSARRLIQAGIVLTGIASVALLIHADRAEREIFKYMYGENADLNIALHDLYFNRFAEKLMMQSLLYHSIEAQDKTRVPLFIQWAEKAIRENPELGLFILLSDAYGFIGDTKSQCQVAEQGLAAYPVNTRLQKTVAQCSTQEIKENAN